MKIESMVTITGAEYESLRAEVERLRAALDRAADRFFDAGMNDEWAEARAALEGKQ